MLIEIAIGDSYGAGFEFASQEFVLANNNLSQYHTHHLDKLKPGMYTDDTQMSLAVAEHILEGRPYSAESFAESFVRAFHRDERKGYAKGFYDLLMECQTGSELLAKIKPTSIRNGAMMRSIPLGIIEDSIPNVLEIAGIQARVTHDTPEGIFSSKAIALISYMMFRGYDFENSLKKLKQLADAYEFSNVIKLNWNSKVECDAIETLSAVLTVLKNCRTFSSILKRSIDFTGDTDSVASIALGLASLDPSNYLDDLYNHPFLRTDMENGDFGLDFILKLDTSIQARRIKLTTYRF